LSLALRLKVLETQAHTRGKVYKISADGKLVVLLLTFHALERAQVWTLTDRQVIRALLQPEEVLKGHRNRFIAHRRVGRHVVRVVYEYDGNMPSVVTVYYPFAARYFRGGGLYEDQILA